MRRWLSPKRIMLALSGLKGVRAGGGPRRIKLLKATEPRGLIVPTSLLTFEVEALDGTLSTIETAVPMPFLYGWGYRIGKALHLPVLSRFDAEKLRFDVRVPRRGGRAAANAAASSSSS